MEWSNYDASVFLTKPSLGQCQEVISKLKENNHHKVYLRNSSSYIIQFLLPELLKMKIMMISIYSTKVVKDNIIPAQLSNNAILKTLEITRGSINDDGIIILVQSLKYNKSITMLYLNNNPDITSASASSLAELLLNNHTLVTLWLFYTSIDTAGVLVLSESLKINKRLGVLQLDKQHEQTCYFLPYYETIKKRLHFA